MNIFSQIFGPEQSNTGATNAASLGAGSEGAFALDQARRQAGWASGMGDEIMGVARDAAGRSLGASDDAMGNAKDMWTRYQSIYEPNEDRLASDVANYDSADQLNKVRQRAAGDVNQSFDTAAASRAVQLSRMGVNPNSGRFADPNADSVNRALATAGAVEGATADRQDKAIALREQLAQFGTTIPQLGAQQQGLALNASNAGTGAINAAAGTAGTLLSSPSAWINAGTGAFNTSGQLQIGQQNANTGVYNAQANAFLGFQRNMNDQAGTVLGSMFSSKKMKRRTGRVVEGEVVKAIKSMPVDRWRYKPKVTNDSAEHIGPYAEDFKTRFGVGDGKTISVIDAIGVTFAAVKGLAKKVDRLEANRGQS